MAAVLLLQLHVFCMNFRVATKLNILEPNVVDEVSSIVTRCDLLINVARSDVLYDKIGPRAGSQMYLVRACTIA